LGFANLGKDLTPLGYQVEAINRKEGGSARAQVLHSKQP
jgi:hypothetical protein